MRPACRNSPRIPTILLAVFSVEAAAQSPTERLDRRATIERANAIERSGQSGSKEHGVVRSRSFTLKYQAAATFRALPRELTCGCPGLRATGTRRLTV